MSRTQAMRHVHRYMRTRPRMEIIWKCMLPGCTHFIPLNTTVLGRNSICWECGEVFVMEDRHLNEEMPKCDSCSGIAIENFQDMNDYIEKRLKQVKHAPPKSVIEVEEEQDEIEVEDTHSAECETYVGGECTCK